ALSLALGVSGVIGQFAGAFLGACCVYLLFKGQFDATEDPNTKRGVFCTSPSIPNKALNMLSEIVATFVLVFAIKGIGQVSGIAGGLSNVFVFGIITSIGMSLGGLTGYAINPARDWGPRIAHALLPIKGKGPSGWDYAVVPMVGPIIGALLAVGLYAVIPW
ncbi:MAG: MIP/aquaporin family protein, partial [[Clostridium] scindens]